MGDGAGLSQPGITEGPVHGPWRRLERPWCAERSGRVLGVSAGVIQSDAVLRLGKKQRLRRLSGWGDDGRPAATDEANRQNLPLDRHAESRFVHVVTSPDLALAREVTNVYRLYLEQSPNSL